MDARDLIIARRVSRRTLLKAGATGAIAVTGALFGTPEALSAPPRPSTRNPLHIPPTISSTKGTLAATLTERPALVDLGGGKLSNVWAYNSLLPGPTLVAS